MAYVSMQNLGLACYGTNELKRYEGCDDTIAVQKTLFSEPFVELMTCKLKSWFWFYDK